MTLQKMQHLLGTVEAARLIGVSPDTLRRWAKAGRVRHIKTPGRRMLFEPEDLVGIFEPVEVADEPAAKDRPLPGLSRVRG